MVHVIRVDELPAQPADVTAGAGQVQKVIGPENVGARRVAAERYDLRPGSSSRVFQSAEIRQFFYILAGAAKAHLDRETQTVRAGHGIYAEPGEPCHFSACGEEGLQFLRFTIPPSP